MTLRVGLLSTARINRRLLAGAAASDRVEVVAVASRDRARAEAYAREHGIERAHGRYEELLADPAVDAVYVSLPNALHVEWSIRALEAGKHVLCEKPLASDPAEAERAFDAAERAGRVLAEGFMYRHHPQTKRLAELVAGGAIGELRLVRSCFSFPLARAGDVRLSRELGGGALMDVGCYCVSASRLLAGEPVAAAAQQVVGAGGVDVRLTGLLRFPGDVLATFDCALDLPHRHELEAVGSEGSLVVAWPWQVVRPGIELRRGEDVERIEVPGADSYRLELEDLADAAEGRGEPLLGRADAVGQARAIALLYRAAGAAAGR